jgi:subtilase family serine protease
MRRSPSALLSLCNSSTLNSSTRKHSTHPHSSRTFWLVASLMACLFVIASPLLAQQAPALVTQTVNNSVRTVLPNNVHPLARPEFDQGEAPADLVLHRLMLVLKRSARQETALRHLIENQQYKKSPSYQQWLTPLEFGAQFGPADSDIAAVTNWLQASGFQVSQVSNGRTVIEFSGTVGQVKQAFGTAIHRYAVNGEQHLANVSNPSIPTALAPVVAGVNSLHSFLKKPTNIRVGTYSENTKQLISPAPGLTSTTLCPAGEATCYAVGPYDFATIYNVLPLWKAATPINGTGQTIAIVGRTDINPDDATAFWNLFGLDGTNAPQPTLKRIYNGPNPGIIDLGDEAEADTDTQWSGAVAPGATIDLVISESTETDDGVDLSAIYIVDNNLAPIMSASFSECEANLGSGGVAFFGAIWEQAAAQGISVMVSSGDNGSAGCDNPNINAAAQFGLNVNGLASTPFNVAVGGTDFDQFSNQSKYWNSTNAATTQESAKGYIPETSWNQSCTNALWVTVGGVGSTAEEVCNSKLDDLFPTGGGGGASGTPGWVGFKPAWQTGPGVPADNTRDLPDVSLFASANFVGSFYVICQSDAITGGICDQDHLEGAGGTSFAAPAFAGIMALVNQKMGLTHPNFAAGNPNFALYNLASNQPTAFHDVPSGTTPQTTNAMPCVTGSPNCVTNTQGDQVGVLSGYTTTAGYDLVTGLGSVNAANLVNNWGKATFTPTTTTLTLSVPANTTHGTQVPVTVSVSPNPGSASNTQAEDVAILVSPGTSGATPPNPVIDWNSLTDGTVTWNTTLLPGGTYKVVAHYEGDTTYGGSYSAPSASVTVKPENSTVIMPGVVTGVTSQDAPIYSTSVVYGTGAFDLYLLRADVYNAQNAQCTTSIFGFVACPTGTIGFTDSVNGGSPNTLDASPYTLNSLGYTEDQAVQLTGGTHVLVANYSGDNSYNKGSATATVTVTKAGTTIGNVAVSLNPVNTGQQFTVTATVTTPSYGLAPTGTVSFFYNTTLLGTAQTTGTSGSYSPITNIAVPASLAASLATSIPTAGSYNITATYSGDGNYQAVTAGQSNSVPIVVNAAASFTLAAAPGSVTIAPGGAVGTSTITVTDVGGFTGSVSFIASGLPSGVTASFNPTSTATTSVLTLTASGSATAGTTTVTITGTSGALTATTTVALTVSSAPGFTLAPSSGSMTITPGGAGVTNTITVTDVGGFTGSVSFAASGLPSGVTASFNPTSSASSSVLTLTASSSATAGGPTTVTITGTSGALTATTTVALTIGAPAPFTIGPIANMTISAPGQSGTTQVTLTSVGGFTGQVSIACSLPTSMTGATCPTVNATVPANGSVNATVTINTAAPSAAAIRAATTGMLGFGVLAGVFVFAIPGLRRRKAPLALLLFGMVVLIVSCGGGSSSHTTPPSGGTPPGTYTVNLTATTGSSSVPASFSVTVQ